MKQLLKSFNPKQIFRLKKSRSVSKSAPSSFASAASSSSSSDDSSNGRHHAAPPVRSRSEEIISLSDDCCEKFRFDFVQAFNMMDRDGDGKITRVELESLFMRVASTMTDDEVAEMIREIDRDGDGCISLDELEAVRSVFESTAAGEEELREAFDVFDSDHDGKITADELLAVFSALGGDSERCTLEDCRRMIEGVDKKGDGFVCFEDFTRMMGLQRL